ncbi:MAG: 4-hydroxythreonine-4-phosphate dehydrogenase PdxA [Gammaproteobacteria bacterium]|nr:4-hydroxythreonine-4-phosphate dehydrogenase PdxA [Gammaproteobacteria bacterium]
MYLLYTAGEPAGIGVDLAVLLANGDTKYPIIVIADYLLLQQRANILDCDINIHIIEDLSSLTTEQHYYTGNKQLLCLHIPIVTEVVIGELNYKNAPYVLRTLDLAIELSLSQPNIKGLVTGPIHKGIINDYYMYEHLSDSDFTGHTEYLAEKSQAKDVIMMLACEQLRVALVTTHLPLTEIPAQIRKHAIETIITLLNQELKHKFNLKQPQIYVCGLNPHAGEDGHLGMEEINEIIPAIQYCQSIGIEAYGPFPADTIFTPGYMSKADVVLAMYHDQGLPVLKHLGFGHAVNITLGLPFIRTSVDHGTALDLAGKKDTINLGSLIYAIECAQSMNTNNV